MKKRILASFLSLVLVLSLMPMSALAADENDLTGGDPIPVCTCESLCTEEAINEDCPVCAADFTACAYEAPAVEEESAAANSLSDSGMLSTPDDLTTAVSTGGSYTLANDIVLEKKSDTPDAQATLNVSFTISNDITIDLNGHSIYGNTQDTVIKVPSGKTLTIEDSTAAHEEGLTNGTPGTVKNADGSYTVTYAVYDEGDNLTYNTYTAGAIIGGVKHHNSGGAIRAIHIDSGTVNFEEGIITGTGVSIKNAAPSAIGILMVGSATLNMSGGAISDNWAETENADTGSVAGIGVQLNSPTCTMNVTGGIFANNIAYGAYNAQGAAINNQSGTVKISNAVFSGNQSLSDQRAFNGAINSSGTGTLTLSNCVFVNNTATPTADDGYGGAITISKGSIENCLFSHNSAKSAGGVNVMNAETEAVKFENVLIQHNSGGGLHYRDENHVDIQGATVMDNEDGDASHSYGTQTDVFSVYKGFRFVGNGGKCTGSTELGSTTVPVLEKDGRDFAGWYDNKDCTGEQVTAPAQNTIYYAKWVTEITFDANGGEGTMTAQQITEGDTTTTLTTNTFTKTGYTFAGWNTAKDGSGDSYTDQANAPTTSTTLYAQWTPNTYTISFDANGGEGTMADISATYDTPVTLPANGFTKTGHKFAGWDTDESADNVVYSDESDVVENLSAQPNGTVTLYAVWTGKQVLDPDLTDTVVTYNGQPQKFHVDDTYTVKYYQNRVEVTAPTNAGIYDVEISRAEDDTYAAYHGRIVGGLRIEKAALTVKADDQSIRVGNELPQFTYTVSGWQGSDGDTVTLEGVSAACTDADPDTAGDYTITVSGPAAIDNYTISYVDGTLTVSRRSSGGGGSSSSSSTTTETERNPDGSTTTTVTDKKTGTVTETTKFKDGSTLVVETKKDGTIITTETAKNGVKVRTVDEPGEDMTAKVTIPRNVGEAVVTIPADMDYGMVAVDADTGEIVKLSVPTEDGMIVKLDGSAELVLVERSLDFTDTNNHWAEDAIDFATAHELFAGTSDTTFSPDSPMTRAMLMTVLARFDGQDTTGGAVWYEKAMAWAKENGISDGSNPNGNITREQFATMLWRYAGSPAVSGMALNEFGDSASVNSYAVDAMCWAVSTGIISGMGDGTLAPQSSATRAQVATMLMRFVENLTK